jgi:lambda family phage minor tail protein L
MSNSELEDLDLDAIINLVQLDLNPIGINSIYYFHGYQARTIIFNGQSYLPLAMALKGFEIKVGSLPQPTITIAANPQIRGLLRMHNGLRRAVVRRLRTMKKYLGLAANANYVIGTPQEFFINRPSDESDMSIELELRAIFDLQGDKFPRGVILRQEYPGVGLVRV